MPVKLDNPVWNSLSETQHEICIAFQDSKFYDPAYCVFGAFGTGSHNPEGLKAYSKLADNFFVVGQKAVVPYDSFLERELVCLQMLIERPLPPGYKEEIIKLNGGFDESLFELVNSVQPGYFRKKTVLLGDYFGIFKDGRLVAVAGERMKMHGLTEVSAVVTHSLYTGRGFARELVTHMTNKILSENRIPFLHVAEKNAMAIALYQSIGFTTRRKISFWNLLKK